MDYSVLQRAALGGTLIGLSLSLRLAYLGSSEGISGMVAGLWSGARAARLERAVFLSAMALTGLVLGLLEPSAFVNETGRPLWAFALAGFGVGLGARVANGCTSGHGVLGVARGSLRSFTAALLFMAAAWVVVALYPPIGGEP